VTVPPAAIYASKSAWRILPAGPDPETTDRSKSASLALLLTAGLANILVFPLDEDYYFTFSN